MEENSENFIFDHFAKQVLYGLKQFCTNSGLKILEILEPTLIIKLEPTPVAKI